MKYKIHPILKMFPILEPDSAEFYDLRESIRQFGQLEPVVLDGRTVLDGRNRLLACQELKVGPRMIQWEELGLAVDPAQWIAMKNLCRRSLSANQRLQLVCKIKGRVNEK